MLLLPQRYVFSSKSQQIKEATSKSDVVIATTKVRIFKQITTLIIKLGLTPTLLLLPQRYVFSSKSQHKIWLTKKTYGCYCYHKGTYFQANHNLYLYLIALRELLLLPQRYVFSSKSQRQDVYNSVFAVVIATTKVRIFKQITTISRVLTFFFCCYCYHKGTYFQANHNNPLRMVLQMVVVIATTKVRIFKQITTKNCIISDNLSLLLLPQRYVFSSKSQLNFRLIIWNVCCYWYHKGTYFQASHNCFDWFIILIWLLLLPQRYVFSSKSQLLLLAHSLHQSCYCYHKGTYFQANHNWSLRLIIQMVVVIATTKVRIFKQITTGD